jgi:deazaflavin-dependent oxidoreductase (nitroreductase family)
MQLGLIAVPTRVRMALSGTAIARLYANLHVILYRSTGGRLGGSMAIPGDRPSPPVLLLETIGRRSGKLRTTPLIYATEKTVSQSSRAGDDESGTSLPSNLIVFAANAANPKDPDWCFNLQTDPNATVVIGDRRLSVHTECLRDGERERVWDLYLEVYPHAQIYQDSCERLIPLIRFRIEDDS